MRSQLIGSLSFHAGATAAYGTILDNPDFRAEKENHLHMISVGTERCEIPDAVVLAG
jgi:hypothetical protein